MKRIAIALVGVGLLSASAVALAEECAEFSQKLQECVPYTCTFRHPMTGQVMERRIVGPVDDRCSYVEQMPNGGKMECRYTEGTRRSVAQFLRISSQAKSMGGSVQTTPGGEAKVQSTMNGAPIINPLQTALQSGECKVSGYGGK